MYSIKPSGIALKLPGILIFTMVLLMNNGFILAQNSVGIGTRTPNPNAALHIVSENNNQGLLVPKLTKAEREALSTVLSTDNDANESLIVYDVTDQNFYHWNSGNWVSGLGADSGGGGNQNLSFSKTGNDITLDISGGAGVTFNVEDNDADQTNELITGMNLAGTTLTITESGTDHQVDLSSISGSASDNQQLSYNAATGELTIDDGNTVTLSDADDANELISAMNLSGTTLSITEAGTNHQVDLSSLSGSGTDDQQLTYNSATGELSIEGGNSITLSDADETNELQNLQIAGHVISLTGISGPTQIDLAGYLNTDQQNLSLSGNTLNISNGTGVDLTTNDPTLGQVIKWDGTNWTAQNDNTLSLGTVGVANNVMVWNATGTGPEATSNLYDDGANVGIGNNSPGSALDVTGTTTSSTGFVTPDNYEYGYSSPKKKFKALSPSSFAGAEPVSGNSQNILYESDGLFVYPNSTQLLQAQIDLPNNARITEINIFYSSGTGTSTFILQEIPYDTSPIPVDIASETAGVSGDTKVAISSINHEVKNEAYWYRLLIKFPGGGTANGVYSAQIIYEIDHAD